LFEEQVELTPDSEAVLFEDKQLTYRELNQRANCLAHHLRTLGVGPEVLVGICVERSLEMVVGLLGILKAGGAYVPLDPAYPPERLAFMLEDSQLGVLLTQARLVESLPKHQGRIVCLDTDWEIIERQSKENPECSFTPENLAYVIYTSGSTGKPKGVLVAHSGVSNLATALIDICNVQPNSRVLQFCSLSFDGSVTELMMALLSGATMVMGTRETLLPGPSLIQLLRDFAVTTVALLPSALAVLPVNELPALRTIIVAGEACSGDLVAKWSSGRRFFNGYGPTECTVCTTMIECTDSKEAPPIGRPLPNTQVYILDAQKQLVPIGVPGELYIGGVGVTRGYLNRPELTAERFIPNPFSNDSGSRLYKTGDLTRYLPDGNIEFLGRIDQQVKIRGFRIELGEIEAVLRQNPAVEDAVVIGHEYDLNDKRLVAYVVPSQEEVFSTTELRRYLKQKLPDHMVPSAFVRLEALPLTPNDKVDRRALLMPDRTRSAEKTFAPPLTLFEEVLAGIWREVLRLDSVGIHDNFFELGGHSLLAVRLLAKIEKAWGKNLPLATIFQSPTIEQLASILRQKGWSAPCQTLVTIQPGGSKPPFFGIHSLGKDQEHYRNIARHLGSDQPIYGLDYWLATRTKDREQAPNTWSVEELAAHYIKEMRILQPEGPYSLAGLSFAGIVAYEMAQQLVTQDQKVALLVLFDTVCPTLSVKNLDFHSPQIHLKNLSQLEMKEKLAYIMMKVKYKIQHYLKGIKPFFLKLAEKFYLKFELPMPYTLHYSLIVEANKKLASAYSLQVYPGKVTLFRASDQAVTYDQISDLGWSALAVGGLEIHEVPGDHLDMFQEPHVQMLAEKLRACIDKTLQDVLEDQSSEPKKSTTEVEYQTNFLNQERLSALQSSLVPIQPHGLKPPVFCVHVLGKGLKFYLPLAHHFALEQPFYGLAAQMLGKKYAPPNRVEDLAAHYIKEMRIIQPEGPYFLAGLSIGGLVAFEIAQQLVAQGQQVALLALLDTYAPDALQQLSARQQISAHWNKFLQLGPTYILEKTIKRLNDKLNHSLKTIGCKFYLSIGQPLPNNLQDFTFEQENQEAASNYVPQAYSGQVTLFQATDEIVGVGSYLDPLLGWGELAVGGLKIHEVPSTHLGMLQEPHVQVLAEKLKACIERGAGG